MPVLSQHNSTSRNHVESLPIDFVGFDALRIDSLGSDSLLCDSIVYESLADSLLANVTDVDTLVSFTPLPKSFFVMPPIYTGYQLKKNPQESWLFTPEYSGDPALRPFEDGLALARRKQMYMQYLAIHSPFAVPYNLEMLPEAPKEYEVVINPQDYTLDLKEIKKLSEVKEAFELPAVERKHWLKVFNASLQFSQAYISPNWYQGGNNNVNMLLNLNYNVKLNQKFHPNVLFEFNAQYKLGMNNAPTDTVRSYNISEDILQLNTTFGYKAIKKWYYTITGQFKTQLFNSYPANSRSMRSALLSPGELNLGIGMTYNTTSKDKKITFDASISPLSYNLKTCVNHALNPKSFGIDTGRKTKSTYGSSAECKLAWKITNNISLQSRLFMFTDYDRGYADWQNTLVFEINRFLTTQLYTNIRYDSHTPYVDEGWHKLQIKEILSLGFSYKFSTL